jgi:hypothetical protein
VDVDGGQFTALDLVQHGLSGDAERLGGRGERQPAVGRVLANALAELVGEPDPPGRARGDLLAGDEPLAQPAVYGRGGHVELVGGFRDRDPSPSWPVGRTGAAGILWWARSPATR